MKCLLQFITFQINSHITDSRTFRKHFIYILCFAHRIFHFKREISFIDDAHEYCTHALYCEYIICTKCYPEAITKFWTDVPHWLLLRFHVHIYIHELHETWRGTVVYIICDNIHYVECCCGDFMEFNVLVHVLDETNVR